MNRVLNPRTGHISPQFHVIYDKLFQTVLGKVTDKVFDDELWNSLLDFDGHEQRLTDYDVQHANDTVVVDAVPRKSDSHDAV